MLPHHHVLRLRGLSTKFHADSPTVPLGWAAHCCLWEIMMLGWPADCCRLVRCYSEWSQIVIRRVSHGGQEYWMVVRGSWWQMEDPNYHTSCFELVQAAKIALLAVRGFLMPWTCERFWQSQMHNNPFIQLGTGGYCHYSWASCPELSEPTHTSIACRKGYPCVI